MLPEQSSSSQTYFSSWEQILPLSLRVFVWGIFFSILYLLSSFFVLVFLTFVFAYLQANVVRLLLPYAKGRRFMLVVLVGILFLSLIIANSIYIAPRVYHQAADFAKEFSVYIQGIDRELLELSRNYPALRDAIPELQKLHDSQVNGEILEWTYAKSPTGSLLEMLFGLGEATTNGSHVKSALDQLANIGGKALAMISTFLLALLFSFLIVLDLPRLAANVRELEHTKLRFIYLEVAGNIYEFGKVLGHAIQAQFYIACVNTLLTALGLYFLGMGNQVAFLAVIVFLCSFIPVVGVFISTVPICLVALKLGGLQLTLLSILMIIIVHLLEAYVLNPNIYSARMRINPVIVLIILTIGGKLFHIWGLILGVPVCTYIFGHAIRYKKLEGKPGIFRSKREKSHIHE